MNTKKIKITVFDKKYKPITEFKGAHAIAEFEKWAGMKPRTAYYWKKKGEMIRYVNGKLYQVRFL